VSARVLVVDDDDQLRRALATSLTRAGFVVTTADDGAPAMQMSEANRFELVIVDYNMKTTTGADVVRHYKERFGAQIFCLVLSGQDDEETRTACLVAGADVVMLKPASVQELRRTLSDAVRGLSANA